MWQPSLDRGAAERVRAVEDDDAHALVAARARDQHRRPDERVVASADVLHVDDDDVEAVEVGALRRQIREALAVQADDAGAVLGVGGVADADHVLRVAGPAVLGAEEHLGNDAELDEHVGHVDHALRDGRGMGEETDPRFGEASDEVGLLDEEIEAGLHGRELT